MTLKTKSTISFEEDERKILQTASDLILALYREMIHHDASWAIDHAGGVWHAENEIEDIILFALTLLTVIIQILQRLSKKYLTK